MENQTSHEVIMAYKAFDENMQCRGYQYEIGGTYTHEGEVKACGSGFHACEYPLDMFNYYAPASSKFAVVEQSGDISKEDSDSKVASRHISIKASIDLPDIVNAAIDFTMKRTIPSGAASNTGYRGASNNTGTCGASINTGDYGASNNTGDYGAASNTGDYGASNNTGFQGASNNTGTGGTASNTGTGGTASNTGYQGVAFACGRNSKARSDVNGAIVCVYKDKNDILVHIRASKVGENGIKPMVWYTLDQHGEFVEVKE